MNGTAQVTKYRHGIVISAILLFPAFLNFRNVWSQVFPNACNAAAVWSFCSVIPSSEWGGTEGTAAENEGVPSIAGTGNQTLTGLQNGVSGPSGITGSLTGNQNSLYDCAGYKGKTGV
jgi:hypothetical protein